MLTARPIRRRDLILLLSVVLVAAVLRFAQPGIVEFFHDEAMVSMLAQDMADGKIFPTTGILSSVGIPNPPTSIYVMWLPYLASSDPLLATLFVAALNVIGVGLLWWLAYRYLSALIATIAGLFYALNPWAILYSRKIWAQDYHTPFVLLALLLGLYGFAENAPMNRARWWAQVLCLPILLFALQIHFAAWALLPLYGWLLWQGRRQIRPRALIVSLILAFLVLLPYLIGLAQTLEHDPTRISDTLNRSGLSEESSLTLSADPIIHLARFAFGLGLETWVAPQQQADLVTHVPIPSVAWVFIGCAVLVGLLSLWLTDARRIGGLLILWLGLPILVFLPTWTDVYPHYFIGSIPALALLAGIGVSWFRRMIPYPRVGGNLMLAGFVVVLALQGFWWRDLLSYLDTTTTPLGFTTPLHYLLPVRDELSQYDDVVIISDGMYVLFDKEPARWSVMLHDSAACTRTLIGDGYAVFPDGPFAVAVAPNAPSDPIANLYQTAAPKVFPVRPDDGQYTVYAFDSAPDWPGPLIAPIDPVRFDNGVQLTGYHLEADRLYLEWALPAAKPDVDYQYTGHFLDADGARIAQKDANFWPGRYWCAGDRLITWTAIDAPDDAATLRVSIYLLGTGRDSGQYFSANVLDAMGNPAGQWIDIPLTES